MFAYANNISYGSYMYAVFMSVFTFVTLFNIPDYLNEGYLWRMHVKTMVLLVLINACILASVKLSFYKFILVCIASGLYNRALRHKKKMLIGLTDRQSYMHEFYVNKINDYAGSCFGYCLLNFIIFVKLVT